MPEQIRSAAMGEDAVFADTLKRVGAEVLETMFFDEAVAAPCDHSWIASAASIRVAFEGSRRGQFLLSVSAAVARSIAPAFLGIDLEEITEAQSFQVLLELANILCGSVLSQLWPDADLILAGPEPVGLEGPVDNALHQCFLLPEGMLSISIRIGDAD